MVELSDVHASLDVRFQLSFGDVEGCHVHRRFGFDVDDVDRAVILGILALDIEMDTCGKGDDSFGAIMSSLMPLIIFYRVANCAVRRRRRFQPTVRGVSECFRVLRIMHVAQYGRESARIDETAGH